MNILIVEDEPPIARYIEEKIISILCEKITSIRIEHTLNSAIKYLKTNQIDLCMLDLNLKGQSGYDLLEHASSLPFATIIISAYTEKAITAFEYGVIDFIPKPFNKNRLQQAFDRYFDHNKKNDQTKYLVYRKKNKNHLLPIENIKYLQAESYIVKAVLDDKRTVYLEKSLKNLEIMLPPNFVRTHRSYMINIKHIKSYQNMGNGVYTVELNDGLLLPLSRRGLKELSQKINSSQKDNK